MAPNFKEFINLKEINQNIKINVNNLSLLFYVFISCLTVSLIILILEILQFIFSYYYMIYIKRKVASSQRVQT